MYSPSRFSSFCVSLVLLIGCSAESSKDPSSGDDGKAGTPGAPGEQGPTGVEGPRGEPGGTDLRPGFVNPTFGPYLAKGDGVTDDTAAIQKALDDVGSSRGGTVYLPTGNYLIKSHLTVPAHTALVGVFRAPPTGWANNGTTLHAVEGAGDANGTPFITLAGPNSTLEKLIIYYPNQTPTEPPVVYPWTIRGGGIDTVSIIDVMMVNPYNGVDLASNPSGRHYIRGLYGQPLGIGIDIDQCYDTGRIENVHFWPFWSALDYAKHGPIRAFQSYSSVGIRFRRADWEIVSGMLTFGYHVGIQFAGATNGQFTNINFDNTDVGFDVYQSSSPGIHVTHLNCANAGIGGNRTCILGHAGAGTDSLPQLNVSQASFWGTFKQAVNWQAGGLLSISDSRFLNLNASSYQVELLAGRAMIHDNVFEDGSNKAIRVGPATDRVMLSNNMLGGNSMLLEGPKTVSSNNMP